MPAEKSPGTRNDWDDIYPVDETPDESKVPLVYEPKEYDEIPAKVERSAAERAKVGPNQATELVQLARAQYSVVRGDDSKIYAVAHALPGIAFGLRGTGGLRQKLAAAYYDEKGRAASGSALQDALAVLEGDALQASTSRVFLRVGSHASGIIVDRATPSGHIVRITPKGWDLLEKSPILFRRTAVSNPMPPPEKGGHLDRFRELLNVDERRFRLVVAFVVAAFMPDIAHPILALTGQQGTAKTTAARMILSFIDPSPASLQSQPRSPEDWAVAAHNFYGVGLDNVSRLAPWLQDALCKAVTGDAFIKRELYSDDSVSVLHFRRPIALTTIDPGALQGDVADRLLLIELQPINASARRTEADVQAAIEEHRAGILGVLFTLLAKVLRVLPTVKLDEMPRMADFATVLAALDQVTGWSTLTDYLATTIIAAHDVLDGDSFATAVVALVTAKGRWEGTCLQLLGMLGDDKTPRDWPATPRAVSARLMRLTPSLAAADGIVVERRKERSNHGAIYVIRNDRARRCTSCGDELSAALELANVSSHPDCEPTIYQEESR